MDEELSPDDELLRRVVVNKDTVRWDVEEARWVPTSGGFKVDDDGLSTFIHRRLTEAGQGPANVGASERPATVFTLSVADVSVAGADVHPDPQPVPEAIGHAHALVTFPVHAERRRVLGRLCMSARVIWGLETLPPSPT